jgi:ABC-type transport system involved in cytochrome bd biosynthesis fused ATPase/permease subunit
MMKVNPNMMKAKSFFDNQTLQLDPPTKDDFLSMAKMFHPGLDITFDKVSIDVLPAKQEIFKAKILRKEPPKSKQVVHDVSGRFPSGTFTILMGSSGAGKTTFLNYISQRNIWLEGLKATGEIRANGVLIEDFDYKSFTAYVM